MVPQLRCAFLLFFLKLLNANRELELNVNDVVDFLLPAVEEELGRGHSSGLAGIQDLETSSSRKWINMSLTCTGGKLVSVGSIGRCGDVHLMRGDGMIGLRAALTFNDLRLRYDRCRVKGALLMLAGSPLLTFETISFEAQLSVRRGTSQKCTNELDYLSVRMFGDVRAEVGGGKIVWFKNALANYAVKMPNVLSCMKDFLESDAIKAFVKELDLCFKIFFLARN